MGTDSRIVDRSLELCDPLSPALSLLHVKPALRQSIEAAPLHSQQAHRFPVKRQVGSAARQLRCSASPSPSRAVDRGAPSHQKGAPPDVPGEALRRTCPARCALSAPFVARGTAVWIIQPRGGDRRGGGISSTS